MRSIQLLRALGSATVLSGVFVATKAGAAPVKRFQTDVRGDFAVIGNTMGQECDGDAQTHIVQGSVKYAYNNVCSGNPGGLLGLGRTNLDPDSSPDVFWRSDVLLNNVNTAEASQTYTQATARSSAILSQGAGIGTQVPANSTIVYARLYWAGNIGNAQPTGRATFERPNVFSTPVVADTTATAMVGGERWYQSSADVTAVVRQNGTGVYRVAGIDTQSLNANNDALFSGWYMVVLYQNDALPKRNLTVFDSLEALDPNANPPKISTSVVLDGFKVPDVGFDGKLAVMTFEGDQSISGDQLLFKAGAGAEVPLADAANSANNFFNGSRTAFGAGVGFPGDLPQFDGKPGSLSGLDIDIVDISANLSAGLTSATLTAKTTNDVFALGGFVTSIATYQPDFSTSTKTVKNLTRQDGTNQPGDILEYTIVAKNTGSDASKATILRDVLPSGVSYEAGSIKVVDGANPGAKTDPAADDQGEYDAATSTVTVRLGTGATATVGGQIDVGSQSTVSLRVKVKPGAIAQTVKNQASIEASGALGAPGASWLSSASANPGDTGQPTAVDIDQCAKDADCNGGFCLTQKHPYVCSTACQNDAACGSATSGRICDPARSVCVDGCRGAAGNGCPPGQQCSSATNAIGVCGDADTDGDGVPDRTEQRLGTSEFKKDSDGDGLNDNVELTPPGGGAFAAVDTDGDGILDALDTDSDNDCAADKNETAQTYRDPALPKAKADDNCTAAAPICDTRKGLCTITCTADSECGGVGRVCGDGVPRTCIDGCHGGASPVGCPADFACTSQTEALGLCKGVDSDGDGIDDVTEKKLGLDPTKKDSDGDGIDDFVETDGGKAIDTDGDGKIDALDEDSDGDGIPDRVETAADADGDKVGNFRDQDSDGDTIPDAVEGVGDPDKDGKPNFLDLDSDGDTLPDQGETANDFDKDGLGNFVDTDSDNDCVPDQKEPAGGVLNPQIPAAVADANCSNGAVCDGKSGTCTTTCNADRDCASGQVCDAARKLCVAGCRGTGQANCKAGEFCKDGATGVGTCEKDPSLNGDPTTTDDDTDLLQGGGIGCSTSSLAGGASLPFAALGLVGLAIVRRRRRNR